MISKLNKWMLRSGLALSLLVTVSACTDDHFDIQQGLDPAAAQTLWENISSQPQLQSLARILERTPVMKNKKEVSDFTYAQLLQQPQSFTFWAPLDGTYDAQAFLDMLDQAEQLPDNSEEKLELLYKVGREFIQNHLARFNYAQSRSTDEVYLMNSKICSYTSTSFNNIPFYAELENIASSNGTLHVLDGYSPFFRNIKDYLLDDYTPLSQVVRSYEIDTVLNENASVQGAMNSDGKMEYTDSVFYETNEFLDNTSAKINNEDSLYVGIVPATQEAWNQYFERVSALYQYGDSYWYNWNSETKDFGNKNAEAMKFTKEEIDSLAEDRARAALMKGMFISASTLGGIDQDSAALISYVINADSLVTTDRIIYYNPNRDKEGAEHANPMFTGIQPSRASNGYLFELDEFNLDPSYIWASKKEYTMSNSYNIPYTDHCVDELITLTTENRNDSIKGVVEENKYRRFEVYGRNVTMSVWIRLENVLSTSYRLKMVMAPNYMRTSDIQYEADGETPKEVVSRFTANVYYDDHVRTNASSNRVNSSPATIEVFQDSVQEYVIFDRLDFKKCYADAPSSIPSTFPYLEISLAPRYQNSNKNFGLNNNALNIVKVILEPLHDDEK